MQHVLHEHTNQSSDAGVVEHRLGGAGAEDAGGLQEDSGVHRGGEDAKELGSSRIGQTEQPPSRGRHLVSREG